MDTPGFSPVTPLQQRRNLASATILQKKSALRQRHGQVGRTPGPEDAPTLRDSAQRQGYIDADHEREIHSEFDLLYADAQASRGAGSGPGLGNTYRRVGQQNFDPNTPMGGFFSPQQSTFISAMSPIANNNMHELTFATPHHTRQLAFQHENTAAMHPAMPTSTADTEADRWVTIFGFPQGYQDGVLRYMRDRGEIEEWKYSGTNYLAVKFKDQETVAEALGLNGSIMPGDGLPGDNFMIGVKRGAQLGNFNLQEKRPSQLDKAAANPSSVKDKNPVVTKNSALRGGRLWDFLIVFTFSDILFVFVTVQLRKIFIGTL
ncbi:Nup35, nuclear pore complex component [Guillardia theta CCMP2712]|uniref:Nup35, nuclear pore complex component n=1 Tax=Guillardia theta (strain CCMP2712) TaxID=905079 RepID=L1J962_GUITC|nr:Nup35, nuclear pore complex component [Guillardia theta CCMP2712]EKX44644.1 Nup35, nuclear pore complex component [Guillardia theta CCMP2712]|eukprot:XP_005831624.1 Nup35, nuclear pore complex component [Guillardia theta CCMP2712]